jgi:hypothetical protein
VTLARRTWIPVLLALLLCPSPRAVAETPLVTLGPDAEPLRSQFNQDVENVRLLLILDPT